LIAVGKIGRPVGLAGECRIFPQGESLEKQEFPCTLWIGVDKRRVREITLASIKGIKGKERARFEGYTDRDSIDTIKNTLLFLEKSRLPEVDDDEFYFYQLKGLNVESEEGVELGTVFEVFNFPTTDAIEVKKSDGKKVLVPFRKETIVSVSLEEKKIVLSSENLEELL
ncbi:MAG: 16S rRNA processing protein RimM, partial [Proteobacteria bacterium]|nr:16S rRNA processing protein RimM [Pseudomonadota bacterium]